LELMDNGLIYKIGPHAHLLVDEVLKLYKDDVYLHNLVVKIVLERKF